MLVLNGSMCPGLYTRLPSMYLSKVVLDSSTSFLTFIWGRSFRLHICLQAAHLCTSLLHNQVVFDDVHLPWNINQRQSLLSFTDIHLYSSFLAHFFHFRCPSNSFVSYAAVQLCDSAHPYQCILISGTSNSMVILKSGAVGYNVIGGYRWILA